AVGVGAGAVADAGDVAERVVAVADHRGGPGVPRRVRVGELRQVTGGQVPVADLPALGGAARVLTVAGHQARGVVGVAHLDRGLVRPEVAVRAVHPADRVGPGAVAVPVVPLPPAVGGLG